MNPRRTKPPETVFETAAFDRSATPPQEPYGQRNRLAASFRGLKPPRQRVPFDLLGEVAEWLKAAPC